MNETAIANNGAGKNWNTKREIAAHFKCHVRTVTKLMHRKVLPFVKIGRLVRLDVDECDRAMEKYKFKGRFD